MSILELLGLKGGRQSAVGDTETVQKIVAELGAMEPGPARYLAAFAFLLSRVANADLRISDPETRQMEEILRRVGGLSEAQASLAVRIAQTQSQHAGGTENFLVARELKEISTREQREEVLRCLFAVSAADDSISSAEEAQIRQIASELGFSLEEYVKARGAWSDKREVLKGLLRRPD